MTSAAQVAIVKDHLEDAIAKGAKVLTGGPDAISGNYIQPTVLTDVDHKMKVMTRRDVRSGHPDPARSARSTRRSSSRTTRSYGLGSSVFAGKAARAIAGKLRAGHDRRSTR